jgi:hypothetical protein
MELHNNFSTAESIKDSRLLTIEDPKTCFRIILTTNGAHLCRT